MKYSESILPWACLAGMLLGGCASNDIYRSEFKQICQYSKPGD